MQSSIDQVSIQDLVRAIAPDSSHQGFLVVQFGTAARPLRAKIPIDQIDWFFSSPPDSKHLAISCSAFNGRAILPNFSRTQVISIPLSLSPFGIDPGAQQIFEKLWWRLDKAAIPAPSLVARLPGSALAIWVLDEAIDSSDLHEVFQAEAGLRQVLGDAVANRRSLNSFSASRFIPLSPGKVTLTGRAGRVVPVGRKRLRNSVFKHLNHADAEAITVNCETLSELSSLLFSRLLRTSPEPDLYQHWMSSFSAAAGPFVDAYELVDIGKSIAESMEKRRWGVLKDQGVPGTEFSYAAFHEVLVRNIRAGYVKLQDQYTPINDGCWTSSAANALRVNQQEANELQLQHLLKDGQRSIQTGYFLKPRRQAIGFEDYVPLGRGLLRAA